MATDRLPRFVAPLDQSWRERAACHAAALPTRWFFPERGETVHPLVRVTCAACPVREDCLAFALAASPRPTGIWGGLSDAERRRLRRGRRLAQPAA